MSDLGSWAVWGACLCLAWTHPTDARGTTPAQAVDIRAREQQLADALHAADRQQLEQLLAPDYVLRGAPDIDRATWVQNAVTLCWGDRSDIDGFRSRRHGDVIVATFELTFYADPVTCRAAVLRSLITDIWTWQPGGWRLQVRHAAAPPEDASVAAQYGAVPQPPPTWDVRSEASLVATGGNTSTRTLGAGGNLTHRTEATRTQASIAFLTSEVDDVTRARSLTLRGRHGLRRGERLELFADASYSRDRFAGIDRRVAIGAGMAYTLSLARGQALTTEGVLGFTAERRLDEHDLRFATATGAVRYRWTVVPGTELTQDAELNADLEMLRNWRGTSTTAVTVTLTSLLSLKASHSFEYRHLPVAGFGRWDVRTGAAVVFAVQRFPGTR